MAPSICGNSITSKRSLLALGWSVVNTLALISFLTAFLFALSAKNINNQNQQYYNQGDQQEEDDEEVVIAVTSRAMAFAALWTAVIAGILGSFGTMLLGVVMPNGKYYWCCAGRVHRTTPLVLGAFVGALLMFANLTLVCSVLFGEFEIRDYKEGEEEGGKEAEEMSQAALSRTSLAFSIMCMFLTVLYAGFAALVFTYSDDLLAENQNDMRAEALSPSEVPTGYINSDRFRVQTPINTQGSQGYVKPQPSDTSESVYQQAEIA